MTFPDRSLRKVSWHRWNKVRKAVFARDDYLCQYCKRKRRVKVAVEVDHVVPVHKGGSDDMDNLLSTCKACHETKTRIDLGLKPSGACGIDGQPLDKNHAWYK